MGRRSASDGTVRVNRAPVLTLWIAVVAERLGHPPESALSLASALAGTAAKAKAVTTSTHTEVVTLLGHDIPVFRAVGGAIYADANGQPSPAEPVRRYLDRAFGSHLGAVRAAMEGLAAQIEAEALNRLGFRLYDSFRPDMPEPIAGWGRKGELRIERIRGALQSLAGTDQDAVAVRRALSADMLRRT